jgi:hypothetical protein
MIKLKNILQEKKDLDNKQIDYLEKLTDRNEHTLARKHLAKLIGNKKLVQMYEHIFELHLYFRDINDLKSARERLDKELFRLADRKFGNFKDVYNRGF